MAIKTVAQLIHGLTRYKEETAIIYRTGIRRFTYSYKDILLQAKKVAALLKKNNLKKGDSILLWAPNSPEWVFTALGAILNGIILVPVDVNATPEFAKTLVKKTSPKLIFTAKFKPKLDKKTYYLEDLKYDLEKIQPQERFPKILPNDILEIVFTSGTTGKPKGVVLKHKHIASNLNQLAKMFEIKPGDQFLSVLPLSHMFEQTNNLWVPLRAGAKITYLKSLSPTELFEAIQEEQLSYILLVPRILELLVNHLKRKFGKEVYKLVAIAKKFPLLKKAIFFPVHHAFGFKFRAFVVGGAPLDPELEKLVTAMGFTVLQGYGLTETSPVLSVNTFEHRKPGSGGKILHQVKIKFGKDNEILVKGPNVFEGYYQDPQKTRESFEKGWYKTGDIGEIKDGFLFIKTRKKDMIVTSAGMNIYPEDIEYILNKIPGVKDSCVLGLGKAPEIHAVLLLETPTNPKRIVDQANTKLADVQKIQDYTVWPDFDFPRTTTLKIRKNIVLEYLQTKQIKQHKASMISSESKLSDIIYHITKKRVPIKPSSSLGSDLKLTSLDRVELAALIEQNFHREIDETAITAKTTVKHLAELIKKGVKVPHLPYPRWAVTAPVKAIREILQHIFFFRLLRYFCDIKVVGKQNLTDLNQPVIFIANHTSHYDGPAVIYALPEAIRKNLGLAAWAEYFFKEKNIFLRIRRRVLYYFFVLGYNIYPFPQTRGFRKSLRHTGYLIDKGNNILIFPEGERSRTGKPLPFRQGIGLITKEVQRPIVPIKIKGAFELWPRSRIFPKKGTIKIIIGKPISFTKESAVEITNIAYQAVKKL